VFAQVAGVLLQFAAVLFWMHSTKGARIRRKLARVCSILSSHQWNSRGDDGILTKIPCHRWLPWEEGGTPCWQEVSHFGIFRDLKMPQRKDPPSPPASTYERLNQAFLSIQTIVHGHCFGKYDEH
jgi:hypothetical protein